MAFLEQNNRQHHRIVTNNKASHPEYTFVQVFLTFLLTVLHFPVLHDGQSIFQNMLWSLTAKIFHCITLNYMCK